MEKTLKKLAKVIDRMMDHVDLYGGPSVVSDDDLEHYLDPVFYLIFCTEKEGGMPKLKDKAFIEWVYTDMLPHEVPYSLNFLPFAKTAIEDFYYCMYKEKHITKSQYQEIAFVLAEKQPIFFARMSKPQFWS
ncbi:plasmid pRiA4b ORF-3 family protein, partial [Listeria monocytogenes]|nr:plasmid pRiA4b ORF-3 family protein [Listeria monocytogenes]